MALGFKTLLKENKTLKELWISHNDIRDIGAAILAEGLLHNDTLTDLEVHNSRITLQGGC